MQVFHSIASVWLTVWTGAMQVYQIELTSNYTRADWTDALKAVLRNAGEKAQPTVFLFSDTQIKEECMVEDISSLLNTGEVPNLFDASDQVAICEGVSARAKKVGRDGSRAELFAFFCGEVSRNLHIVLAFSPIGDAFRTRLRKFPSLVTSTTINWCAPACLHCSRSCDLLVTMRDLHSDTSDCAGH